MNRFLAFVLVVSGCVGEVGDMEARTATAAPTETTRGWSPPSSSKELTRFSIAGRDAAPIAGGFSLLLPWGTKLDGLTPVIEHTGVRIEPEGAQSFAQPVTYTVIAEDGSRAEHRVEVSAEVDAIDLSKASVFNSPADVASWPVATRITRLTMTPSGARDDGLSLDFSARATWPDYTPPGWDGPIQYTVWAVVKVNGAWVTSGFIQMWRTRASTGAPILTDFARNWAYDSRWGPMAGYSPAAGEELGFFVTAGNARGEGAVTSARERSNVIRVALPAGDTGTFDF